MRARIRDTEIYFDVEGPGLVAEAHGLVERPPAFMIHGGPGGDHTSLRPALSPLADTMQLIFCDHRGHGRSARGPRESYTLENNVEDLEALRAHLGLDKVVLVGVSYGGMVALTYAARYPEHVSHLIAVVTASHGGFIRRAQEILAERGTPEQRRVARRLWDGAFESEEQMREFFALMGPLYSTTFDPAAAAAAARRATYSPDAINEAFGGFLRSYDVTEQLGRITAPTLVIAGRHDWICAPEFSELIAARIPRADLRIFERSAHRPWADEREAFFDVVRGFLADWRNA
jgi:proline iminopeptidase